MTMLWRILGLGGAMLAGLALGGCGGSSYREMRSTFVEFDPAQRRTIAADAGRAYRIQEGDILRIAFPYEKELTQEGVVVLADGAVSLVGVDRIVLAGHTLVEADSIVTAAYAKDYIEPSLSVIVAETPGRRVYVLGEVKDPGMFKLPAGGLGIVNAIALAGGFREDAAKGGTVLVRVSPEGYLVQEIDLDAIHRPEAAALAMVTLKPFDIVYVPRSRTGDFAYFSRTILQGVLNITRIAADFRYLSGEAVGRY